MHTPAPSLLGRSPGKLPLRYFDHNATSPLHPAAREAWLEAADCYWHNPSSLSATATAARDMLEDARERLADLLGCVARRILFTGSATAANNALARQLAEVSTGVALISPLEHPCVAESFVAALPGRVVELPVDGAGRVDSDAAGAQLEATSDAAIVSVLAASNETGVLQPWQELLAICQSRQIPFHTDAAQWIGRLPAADLGQCDFVTGSGHKFGGPKGVGFLMVPETASSFHGDRGGPQQEGRWAGTENLPGVLALVAALEAVASASEHFAPAVIEPRRQDRDRAEQQLVDALPELLVLGRGSERLWNTLACIVPGHDGRRLVAALERQGIIASTGSACSGGSEATARAVAAIGPDRLGLAADQPWGMLRLSGGWKTTAADWQAAAEAVVAVVSRPIRPRHVSLAD